MTPTWRPDMARLRALLRLREGGRLRAAWMVQTRRDELARLSAEYARARALGWAVEVPEDLRDEWAADAVAEEVTS